MVIDLKRLFQSEGLTETVECQMDMSGMELGGVKPFCAPVRAHVTLTAFGGSVLMRAETAYTLRAPCDRCCEMVERDYAPTFEHTLVRRLESGEEDGDLILVEGDRLELDRLLQEDILLAMPVKFLCREQCKGLCPVCGKNLNQGSCGCAKETGDPRLSALAALLRDDG